MNPKRSVLLRIVIYSTFAVVVISLFSVERIAQSLLNTEIAKKIDFSRFDMRLWPSVVSFKDVGAELPMYSFEAKNIDVSLGLNEMKLSSITPRMVYVDSFNLISNRSLKALAAPLYPATAMKQHEFRFGALVFQNGTVSCPSGLSFIPDITLQNMDGFLSYDLLGSQRVVGRLETDVGEDVSIDIAFLRSMNQPLFSVRGDFLGLPTREADKQVDLYLVADREDNEAVITVTANTIGHDFSDNESAALTCSVTRQSPTAIHTQWNLDSAQLDASGDSVLNITKNDHSTLVNVHGNMMVDNDTVIQKHLIASSSTQLAVDYDIVCDFYRRCLLLNSVKMHNTSMHCNVAGDVASVSGEPDKIAVNFNGTYVNTDPVMRKRNFFVRALFAELNAGTDFNVSSELSRSEFCMALDGTLNTPRIMADVTGEISFREKTEGRIIFSSDTFNTDIVPQTRMLFHIGEEPLYLHNIHYNITINDGKALFDEVAFTMYDGNVRITKPDQMWLVDMDSMPAENVLALLYPPYSGITGQMESSFYTKDWRTINGEITIRKGTIRNVNVLERVTSYISDKLFVQKMFARMNAVHDKYAHTPFNKIYSAFAVSSGRIELRDFSFQALGYEISASLITIEGEQIRGEGHLHLLSLRPFKEMIWPSWMDRVSKVMNYNPLSGIVKIPFSVSGTISSPQFRFAEARSSDTGNALNDNR